MIRDIMTEEPACCTPETSLEHVAKLMVARDCGAIPIVEDLDELRPVGLLTDRDIVARVLAQGKDALQMVAGDCMTDQDLLTIDPDADITAAWNLMREHDVRRILVVEDDRLIGIVSQSDLPLMTTAELGPQPTAP
jgi:CBS domain-containing protein